MRRTGRWPSISGNVSVRAWQRQEGFANLTTNGVVTVNGTVVPALALLNVTDRTQGNVTESVYEAVHGLLNTRTTEYYFSVNASSAVSVAFAPALGIVPNTLSPGLVWNSTSTFDATGTWSAEYSYHHLPLTGTPIEFHGPISGQVTRTGTVSLHGTDLGPVVLNGGLATDAAAITIDGPFHFYEGFLLVPGNTDVAGGSSGSAWSSYQNDSAEAATGALNIGARTSHLGLLASSSSYAPQSSSPSTVGAVVGSSPATTGSVAPRFAPMSAGPSGGGVLQAQPESVGAAEQNSTCLVGGSCVSPLGNAPGRALPGLLGVLVIGLLVGTIVVMAVVVERRRSTPPPVHPNAQLYPTVSVPAAGSRAPPRPEESSDDDPLGHLW
ncbi:MAG: hypothetical protein L3J91_01525 [Thermoplasmata archaeon]|nr:hypothetical protein [Thermoplasmata archaeon]